MAAERAKREAWMADQTRSIKQATIKGLEPEIQARAAGMEWPPLLQRGIVLLILETYTEKQLKQPRRVVQGCKTGDKCKVAAALLPWLDECHFAPCSAW